MTTPATDAGNTLRVERRFDASRERLYRAFTNADELKRWYAPGQAEVAFVELEARVGGAMRLHMRGPDGTVYRLHCEYRVVDPPAKLEFTWRWEHEEMAGTTLVAIEFIEDGNGTIVKLVHSGFGTDEERAGHGEGWQSLLDKLSTQL